MIVCLTVAFTLSTFLMFATHPDVHLRQMSLNSNSSRFATHYYQIQERPCIRYISLQYIYIYIYGYILPDKCVEIKDATAMLRRKYGT